MSEENQTNEITQTQQTTEQVTEKEEGQTSAEGGTSNEVGDFLDSLGDSESDDKNNEQSDNDSANTLTRTRDAQGRFVAQTEKAEGNEANETELAESVEANPEDEEAALLNSATTERSRERIKKLIDKHNEVNQEYEQLNSQVSGLKALVDNAGMSNEQFATTLEYSRLVNSNNRQDQIQALKLIEAERQALSLKLGIELPGQDNLMDFADLKKSVDAGQLTREHALEMAALRRQHKQLAFERQEEMQRVQSSQHYDRLLQDGQKQITHFLSQKVSDADFNDKAEHLVKYFRDPVRMNEFISTHQPHQWPAIVKFMYDSIQPVASPRPVQQPLRARPALKGQGAARPEEALSDFLDSIG